MPGTFVIALIALLFLLRHFRTDVGAGSFAGYLAGFTAVLYGIGTWWLNAVSPAAWFALTLFSVVLFAAMGWSFYYVISLRWWPLWLASLWTTFDLIRSTVPFHGFPWLRISHTVLDTPFEGVVRWLSLNGTTWLLVLLSGLIVATFEHKSAQTLVVAVGLIAVAVLLPTGLAGGAGHIRIAAVQGNTPGPFGSWPAGEILDLHIKETANLTENVDLVLWPENASDQDIVVRTSLRDKVTEASRNAGAPILVGAILNGPTPDTALNASVPVTPDDGPRSDIYIKQAVVPYGEFVPFRQLLGDLVPRFDREIPRDMIGGSEPGAIHIADTIVGTVICWDVAQDFAIRGSVQAEASFIAVQTSNATFADFGRGIQPEQQWDISRLRAIETGRWVVVASTNGISGFINPHGEVIERLPVREAGTAIQTIDLASEQTWAIGLAIPVMLLIGILALFGLAAGIHQVRKDRV